MADQDDDIGQEIIIEQEGDEEEQKLSPVANDDDDESELETYSKGVQKRISRLTEKFRKEERDREEAVRVAQTLLQEKQQLEGRLKQLDSGYLHEYGARIEAQITSARRNYKDAYEAGDTDRMIEAQEALARASSDKERYDLAKRRADQRVETTPNSSSTNSSPHSSSASNRSSRRLTRRHRAGLRRTRGLARTKS